MFVNTTYMSAMNNNFNNVIKLIPEKYIFSLTKDSLLLIEGSTYEFTVDTPEDKGLISTVITVGKFLEYLNKDKESDYKVVNSLSDCKVDGLFTQGDLLEKTDLLTGKKEIIRIGFKRSAIRGILDIDSKQITKGVKSDIVLKFYSGQRSPMTRVEIKIPKEIRISMENTTINVIGRGEVLLRDLSFQSIGRVGTNYSYTKVGDVEIKESNKNGQLLVLSNLDFRPSNGPDLIIRIKDVEVNKVDSLQFLSRYITSEPEEYFSPGDGSEITTLDVISEISDFNRKVLKMEKFEEPDFSTVSLIWSKVNKAKNITLLQSIDEGCNWSKAHVTIDPQSDEIVIKNLEPNKLYAFKLNVEGGANNGLSNTVWYYSGKMDVKSMGVKGDGLTDDTDKVNEVIDYMSQIGGGVVLFTEGAFSIRTVYLKSNVWLYVPDRPDF